MSTVEILCIALLAFSAFCALVQAVKEVLLAKLKAAADFVILPSGEMVPGTVLELPPGTEVPPATGAAPPGYRANVMEAPPCVCRNLHSITLTPDATYELPPGMKVSPATVDDIARAFKRAAWEVH